MWSPLQLFLAALVFFHSSEFALAALLNPSLLEWSSWLISAPYAAAMALAVAEHVLELSMAPWLQVPWVSVVGLVMVIAGEALRKAGIITAGHNFTHRLQTERRPQHRLVTWGVYRWMRHPGYAGWVLWAVGTQVLLCNPVCTLLFTYLSFRFMRHRIAVEDRLLHGFFGGEWVRWRAATPSGIPGIP